jgi:phage host-nuclease inhibitor protein Gam
MAVSSMDNFAEKQKHYQRYIDELKTKIKSLEKVIQKYQDKETEAYARQAFPEDQVRTNPLQISKGRV